MAVAQNNLDKVTPKIYFDAELARDPRETYKFDAKTNTIDKFITYIQSLVSDAKKRESTLTVPTNLTYVYLRSSNGTEEQAQAFLDSTRAPPAALPAALPAAAAPPVASPAAASGTGVPPAASPAASPAAALAASSAASPAASSAASPAAASGAAVAVDPFPQFIQPFVPVAVSGKLTKEKIDEFLPLSPQDIGFGRAGFGAIDRSFSNKGYLPADKYSFNPPTYNKSVALQVAQSLKELGANISEEQTDSQDSASTYKAQDKRTPFYTNLLSKIQSLCSGDFVVFSCCQETEDKAQFYFDVVIIQKVSNT
jgi:hypothetical protein